MFEGTVYLTSGRNDAQISGQVVQISGQTVVASVTTNISGQVVYLVSGNNAVQISGQTVVASVTTNISGQVVYLASGQNSIIGSVSGNMVSISGQPVTVSGDIIQPQIPTQIRTEDSLLITGASGGIALLSGEVLRLTVRNIGVSGTVMFVGSSGDPPWVASGQSYPAFSGKGFWLRDGDGVTIHTTNMALVKVVAHTSGQRVSYLGEQY